MTQRPPRSKRTDTLFPYTTLFRSDGNALRRFDLVIANPMWNQAFDPKIFENDAFNRFEEAGGITTGKADWAWLQHTVASLKDNGRAAVVLDTGAVTRGSGSKNEDKERNIRRWFEIGRAHV